MRLEVVQKVTVLGISENDYLYITLMVTDILHHSQLSSAGSDIVQTQV